MIERTAYGIDELAKTGPLGRSKLYEAIKNGDLIARKAGRRTIVLAADYERYLGTLPRAGARKPSENA